MTLQRHPLSAPTTRLTHSSFCLLNGSELHDTGALGSAILPEYFSVLYSPGGLEEFNEILVGSRPWELRERCEGESAKRRRPVNRSHRERHSHS